LSLAAVLRRIKVPQVQARRAWAGPAETETGGSEMKKNLLIGLSLLCLAACKDKAVAPTTSASGAAVVTKDDDGDDGDDAEPGPRRGRGRFGAGFCKSATDEQWAALQKCSDKLPAELKAAQDQCNTQIYGSAAPTREQACDRDKRRAAMRCLRDKNVKMDREARKEFFQCSMGIMKGAEEGGAAGGSAPQ
jgi:hypothetical protein